CISHNPHLPLPPPRPRRRRHQPPSPAAADADRRSTRPEWKPLLPRAALLGEGGEGEVGGAHRRGVEGSGRGRDDPGRGLRRLKQPGTQEVPGAQAKVFRIVFSWYMYSYFAKPGA